MKLKEIREAYEVLSGTFSKTSRTLALSGIAIGWLFIQFFQGHNRIVIIDVTAIIAFVIMILLDLLQNYYLSVTWYEYYNEMKEKYHKGEDDEVKENEHLNDLGWIFYKSKFVMLIVGYSLLAICFISVVWII